MLTSLPTELQTEIASYLDNPSLCFFAKTCKTTLKNAREQLIRRHQTLTPKILATDNAFWIYTTKTAYRCGLNLEKELGIVRKNEQGIIIADHPTSLTSVLIPPGTIEQIACGKDHTVILIDQILYGCGANRFNELGLLKLGEEENYKTLTFSTFTLLPRPPGRIRQVVAGSRYYTLVLTDEGLYGYGLPISKEGYQQIDLPPGTIRQIAAGRDYFLVLTEERELYGYGGHNGAPLGLTWSSGGLPIPQTLVPIPSDIVIEQVITCSISYNRTVLVTNKGLYIAGNSKSELAIRGTSFTPMPLPPGMIKQVSVGPNHTGVLTDQGYYTCGWNGYGQLGLGQTHDSYPTLTRVPPLPEDIQQVACGGRLTVALTSKHIYFCGENRNNFFNFPASSFLLKKPGQTDINKLIPFPTPIPLELKEQEQFDKLIKFSDNIGLGAQQECSNQNERFVLK